MTESTFLQFKEAAIPLFAHNKIQNGDWQPAEAHSLAALSFQQLLPQGLHTPQHYFHNIMLGRQNIGYTWFSLNTDPPSTLYLYEIWLQEDQRSQNLGSQVMRWIQQWGRNNGAVKMRLHVFGINRRVVAFYERHGFSITDYNMAANL